jgi:protein-S-isoprenylcysteine O-methyltransferase Ste14
VLRDLIYAVWAVFWIGWLLAAIGSKPGVASRSGRLARGALAVTAVALIRIFHTNGLAVHAVPLRVLGTVLFAGGIGLAVWARLFLGRNWGTPMSLKQEPELVTSGLYRWVRHPIYSGILLATLGTGLATNTYWLIVFAVMGAYFVYSATVEDRLMATAFPETYTAYHEHTRMLIPFVL